MSCKETPPPWRAVDVPLRQAPLASKPIKDHIIDTR